MARAKGPIYNSDTEVVDNDLLKQLHEAVAELKVNMVPNVEITRGNSSGIRRLGYGVRKAKRSISADTVISIARQIKGRPGW